jgi:hypothetical protein
MFNLSYEAGPNKPTIVKVHPPISGNKAHATVPGTFHYHFLIHAFDQNEWCVKNVLHSGGF